MARHEMNDKQPTETKKMKGSSMNCTMVSLKQFQARLSRLSTSWKESAKADPESRYAEGNAEAYEEILDLFEDVFDFELTNGRTLAPEDVDPF